MYCLEGAVNVTSVGLLDAVSFQNLVNSFHIYPSGIHPTTSYNCNLIDGNIIQKYFLKMENSNGFMLAVASIKFRKVDAWRLGEER